MKKVTKYLLIFGTTLVSLFLAKNIKAEETNVYKLYNRLNQEFLYTTNKFEYYNLSSLPEEWILKGEGFKVSSTQDEKNYPVYRFYNPTKGVHLLTQIDHEVSLLKEEGWLSEGVAFYAFAEGENPVYRLKNKTGSYRYPADKETKDALVNEGWSSEGIAWYQNPKKFSKDSYERDMLYHSSPGNSEIINPAPDTSLYPNSNYPWGQCTWYVYNRAQQLGISYSLSMGNGGDWKNAIGYEVTQVPQVRAAVSFSPGEAGADRNYGHVAFVEQVRKDGSILISETNVKGLGVVSYRTFSAQEACQFHYVIGKG